MERLTPVNGTQNDGQGTLSWKIEIVTEISSHNAEYGT